MVNRYVAMAPPPSLPRRGGPPLLLVPVVAPGFPQPRTGRRRSARAGPPELPQVVTTEVPCSLPDRFPPPAYDPVTSPPTPSAGATADRGRSGGRVFTRPG